MSFAGRSDDRDTSGNMLDTDTQIEIYEMQVAIGPTCNLTDGVSVYGGPFYYQINGDVKEDGGPDRYDIETSGFGGYVGAQFRVNENAVLNTELQWATYLVWFAVNLIWELP